uniref:Reverse transcriptase domain-containing protein n=1 Tax=Tanacetum cinerariifolium TaxID=118510 RepID=A0A6L2J936_TANCI|nr:hypothetical protein [Tanacetum cinerariifolium]
MASLSRRLCGRETVHALVEKKGKAKDEFYGKQMLEMRLVDLDQLGVRMPHLPLMSALLLEGKKVTFVASTLQGPALTWWNAKDATRGLKTVNQMPRTKMKHLMTTGFCPIEEIQRMEHEL